MSKNQAVDQTSSTFRFDRATAIWLGIAILLALAGWYKTVNLLMLVGYIMIALALVNAVVGWLLIRGVTARRMPSVAVYPGETVSSAIEVVNESRFASTVTLHDRSGPHNNSWLVVQLQQDETRTLMGRWHFLQRGVHPLGPLVADCSYPFGILHVHRIIAEPGRILILPAVGGVQLNLFRRWIVRGGAHDSNERRPSRRAIPGDGDVRGLRPYRPGDNPRTVHWRSSARRGQLLVHEYDSSQPIHLVVVVEPYLPENPTAAQRDALEWALSLAMTLGQTWCETPELSELTLIIAAETTLTEVGPCVPGMARRRFRCLAEVVGGPRSKLDNEALRRMRGRNRVRLVISSRSKSPLVDQMQAQGLAPLAVHPNSPLPWYNRPKAIAMPL